MSAFTPPPTAPALLRQQWPGALVWALGWLTLAALDGRITLGSLALLLVLVAAVGALWLRLWASLCMALVAVLAFNWSFVPPRHTLAIDLRQDAVLLLVLLASCVLVSALTTLLRAHADRVQRQMQATAALRDWSERLRDAEDPLDCVPDLQRTLTALAQAPCALLALRGTMPLHDDQAAVLQLGDVDIDASHSLWYCLRHGHALGPGTGHYETLRGLCLPLRGRHHAQGAAWLNSTELSDEQRAEAQDFCNQLGVALERRQLQLSQQAAARNADEQRLRAMLLTAIAHDYRTPLATILGAASSLDEQREKLTGLQQHTLARRIVDETLRLRQMTSNILQLARLDTPGLTLHCSWESAEELLGAALARHREAQGTRLSADVAPALPLLWCDATLLSQLLDNLIDNALKYSPAPALVRISASLLGKHVVLAVDDEGPGISDALQERVFQPFQRGELLLQQAQQQEGVGLGLALCRVIADAHGGELRLVNKSHGCRFECVLPIHSQPTPPPEDGSTIPAPASNEPTQ